MKTKRLYLENFIGVKDGMGRDVIDIDFDVNPYPIVMLFGKNGSGKAQPINSEVYTIHGKKPIKNLKIGDKIFGPNGIIAINGIFPQGKLDEYQVIFNDDSSILCSKDHLFKVSRSRYTRQKEKYWKDDIFSVQDILDSGLYVGNTLKYYIPMTNPVEFKKQDTLIDPYVMGCLLGDGSFRSDKIGFTCAQDDILSKFDSLLNNGYYLKKNISNDFDYSVIGSGKGNKNEYITEVKKLDLWEKYSYEKHIPDLYKYNSSSVRLSILQGMFDCDGSVEKGCQLNYYTSSKQLAEDVVFIVESLGGNARIKVKKVIYTHKDVKCNGKQGYRITIKMPQGVLPFTSLLKKSQYIPPTMYIDPNRKIKNIIKTGKTVEMACISVDSLDKLYLTNNFIVTHNTTVLSQLHPGSDNYDDRKDIIIEGKEGKKIYVLKDNDDIFEVTHHYREGKVKSFLKKNDEELNPSGGVKNFAVLAEEHLGFSPDFFKVGKIGSNVTNFVDMISSDRKKYISKFLPNIDPWLNAGKIVSKKFSTYKKNIAFLSDELGKLDTVDNLTETADNASQILSIKQNRVSKIKETIATLQGQLSTLPDWARTNKNPHTKILKEANSELMEAQSTKDGYIAQFKSLEGIDMEDIEAKISAYNTEDAKYNERFAVIESELVTASERIDLIEVQLTKKKDESKSFKKTSKELSQIQELIEEAQEELDSANEELGKLKLPKNNSDITLADVSAAKGIIWSIYENIRSVITEASVESLKLIEEHIEDEKIIDSLMRAKVMAERKRERSREQVDSKKTMLNMLKGQAEQAKTLERRPKDCRLDSCPFVSSAIRFKDAPNQLRLIQNEIDGYIHDEKESDALVKSTSDAYNIVTDLQHSYDQIKSVNILNIFPINEYLDSFSSFCSLCVENPLPSVATVFDVNPTFKVFQARDSQIAVNEKLEILNERLESAQSSDAFIKSISSDIKTLENEQNTLNETIEELETEKADIATKASKLRKKKEIILDLKDAFNKIETSSNSLKEAKTQYQSAESTIAEAQTIVDSIDEENGKLELIQKEINPAQKLYDDARVKLARRQEYEEKVSELEGSFQIVKEVKEALDPVKGIPTLLIGDYLHGIEEVANSLLDIAYNGSFRIGFKITESDFFIEVFKENGGFCQDVKLASQGQVAMIKTTLSLAIFQSALGRYNILCLDEIDSTLDEENRRVFLDILERQIVELNLEQLFCISHNDSFDASSIGLILMPGHTFDIDNSSLMLGKQLIANLSGGMSI
jgi:DNA repair exonuclease SbcCD ATPase subunit